jgi:hypothetical protein
MYFYKQLVRCPINFVIADGFASFRFLLLAPTAQFVVEQRSPHVTCTICWCPEYTDIALRLAGLGEFSRLLLDLSVQLHCWRWCCDIPIDYSVIYLLFVALNYRLLRLRWYYWTYAFASFSLDTAVIFIYLLFRHQNIQLVLLCDLCSLN